MRQYVWISIIVLASCSPSARETPDGGDGGPCTGDETRCINGAYQVCEDGNFTTQQQCQGACVVDLGGCVACDPSRGNACNGADVVSCNPDGSYGTVIETCDAGTECQNGQCARACTADGVDLIYVVDESYNLLSFDPRLLPNNAFQMIGALDCPTTMGNVPGWNGIGVTPFSMSVDRNADAWVLYTSGEIFKVSTQNAACQATGYLARQANMLLFGMGFVADSPGANTEHLYIGGGDPDAEAQANRRLGSVDPTTYGLTLVGNLSTSSQYSPELTGLGDATLFGFYPGITNAFVQQIDKATGAGTGSPLTIPGGLGGTVTAWAFAQWGGTFYIFVTTADGGGVENSTVRAIERASGQYQVIQQNLPYKIVGAGVSTCAPIVTE